MEQNSYLRPAYADGRWTGPNYDHSPSSGAEIKTETSHTSSRPYMPSRREQQRLYFSSLCNMQKSPQKQQFQMRPRKYQPCPIPPCSPYVTLVMTFNILGTQMTQNPHNRMSSIIPPCPGEELKMKDICFCDLFQNFKVHFQAHTVCVTLFSFTSVINWYFNYTEWVSRNEPPF